MFNFNKEAEAQFMDYLKNHRVKVDTSELTDILTFKRFFDECNCTSVIIGNIPKEFLDRYDVKDSFFVEGLDSWVTIVNFENENPEFYEDYEEIENEETDKTPY